MQLEAHRIHILNAGHVALEEDLEFVVDRFRAFSAAFAQHEKQGGQVAHF